LAIECKWSASDFDAGNLQAFRRPYPQGDNLVVSNDVERSFRPILQRPVGAVCKFDGFDFPGNEEIATARTTILDWRWITSAHHRLWISDKGSQINGQNISPSIFIVSIRQSEI
jgi:hypothetical protein